MFYEIPIFLSSFSNLYINIILLISNKNILIINLAFININYLSKFQSHYRSDFNSDFDLYEVMEK